MMCDLPHLVWVLYLLHPSYVLDGFPKLESHATEIFKADPEAEDQDSPNPKVEKKNPLFLFLLTKKGRHILTLENLTFRLTISSACT